MHGISGQLLSVAAQSVQEESFAAVQLATLQVPGLAVEAQGAPPSHIPDT
jgi:hypothetical protein